MGVRGVGEGCWVWVWVVRGVGEGCSVWWVRRCGSERCKRGVLGVGGEEVWVVRGVGEGCWVWGWG